MYIEGISATNSLINYIKSKCNTLEIQVLTGEFHEQAIEVYILAVHITSGTGCRGSSTNHIGFRTDLDIHVLIV